MLHKTLPAILALLFALLLPGGAGAGTCLGDSRSVSTGKHSIRMRDYYCRTASGAQVRVQFHRVTDFVAAAMLNGQLPPIFARILGRPYFIDNPVYREYKNLMDRFGVRHKWMNCETYVIAVSGGGSLQEDNACRQGRPALQTIGGWHYDGGFTVIAVPDDMRQLVSGILPPDYQERKLSPQHGEAREIWRYVTRADFADYPSKVARFNRMMTGKSEAGAATVASPYMRMLDYVSRDGMPKHFLAIDAYYSPDEGCEGFVGWKMRLLQRSMLVDFALIENVSNRPVAISSLLGNRSRSARLRAASLSRALKNTAPLDLQLAGAMLKPGEKTVLFQRLTFVVSPRNKDGFKGALPPYVYGPESMLKGFSLNGERVDLSENLGNYLGLTAGTDGGSCPFVYAWSDRYREFVNHGKILHKANGPEKEQTDSRSFEGLVSRFRISEEEAEIAHLDEVSLTLIMRDGSRRKLQAGRPKLKTGDRKRVSLALGNRIEIAFALPPDLRREDVTHSVLTARGYYQRYSALPFSQAGIRQSLRALLARSR